MKAVIDMNAYFFPSHRRRLAIWREEVLGMPLLRLELPERPTPRMCRKAALVCERCGVHQLLSAPEYWPGPDLPPLSSTRTLWIQKAPEAALFLLRRRGVAPERAKVEFCADRFTLQAQRAILDLLPRVRALSLSLPAPEAFLWRLQRDYGVSPVPGEGDVALCYSPVPRRWALPLWQQRPEIEGAGLCCAVPDAPEGCPLPELLAALEEQGRLRAEEIQICSDFA